jgi:hypothetical protein
MAFDLSFQCFWCKLPVLWFNSQNQGFRVLTVVKCGRPPVVWHYAIWASFCLKYSMCSQFPCTALPASCYERTHTLFLTHFDFVLQVLYINIVLIPAKHNNSLNSSHFIVYNWVLLVYSTVSLHVLAHRAIIRRYINKPYNIELPLLYGFIYCTYLSVLQNKMKNMMYFFHFPESSFIDRDYVVVFLHWT